LANNFEAVLDPEAVAAEAAEAVVPMLLPRTILDLDSSGDETTAAGFFTFSTSFFAAIATTTEAAAAAAGLSNDMSSNDAFLTFCNKY
jgi:hypothetical protein